MAIIKNNMVRRVWDAIAGPPVEELVAKRVEMELNKVNAGDTVRFSPRQIGLTMPGGGTQKASPLGVSFSVLRNFADYYPVARSCIEFRKSLITHLEWAVAPIEITDQTVQDDKNIANAQTIKQLFKYPTGKKTVNFTNWLKQLLEDLLVIDAVALYRRRNRRGDIIGYLPVDGASIELILEGDGTTPEPPNPAYVQRIQGQETAQLTADELIYAMMTPKTYTPYGFAPLETLVITVTTALKLQSYSLGALTEGNVPEGFVTLPRDIASSRDQLKEWQEAWDAMLSGDPRFQRKLKFLPEGMKYEPTVKASDMTFERFEKWLLQVTCSCFSVDPTAIGFNFDINRATADKATDNTRERAQYPTSLFFKELMDNIIQEDLGHPELQFVWTNINPTDKKEEAQTATTLVNGGLVAVDEWRLSQGLKPVGVKDPFILTPVGPIFVKDLVAQSEAGQQPVAPYKPTGAKPTNAETNNLPIPSQAKGANLSAEFFSEIKKWKVVANNDFKEGKPFRNFKSDIIDFRTHDLIAEQLSKVKAREDINKIFDLFLGEPYRLSKSLLKLYDNLNQTAHDRSGQVVAPTVVGG